MYPNLWQGYSLSQGLSGKYTSTLNKNGKITWIGEGVNDCGLLKMFVLFYDTMFWGRKRKMKNTFSGWFVMGWCIVLSGTKKRRHSMSESLPLRQKATVMENVSQNESRFLSVPWSESLPLREKASVNEECLSKRVAVPQCSAECFLKLITVPQCSAERH
jgi:hypothetical protein